LTVIPAPVPHDEAALVAKGYHGIQKVLVASRFVVALNGRLRDSTMMLKS
jgi:hypothetical protein